MKTRQFLFALLTALVILLAGCTAARQRVTAPSAEPIRTAAGAPTDATTSTSAPVETPSATAAATAQASEFAATVWSSDPLVPVLAYHQFQEHGISGPTRARLDDFQAELQSLAKAGYALVPLGRWLSGDLRVPDGKRPLVFTMDDLFYRNQIRFNPDGTIDPLTGLGASYEFSLLHPDFGFSWALFSNLGDKPYIDENNPLILANAIVWCIDHGALVYNHTYSHALLSQTPARGITWELSANDRMLNQLLTQAARPDLIAGLGNIFALPYGKWPRDPGGETAIQTYRNPAGLPMQAIMDVDYIYRPKYMLPPFAADFRRWDVPRIVATVEAVDYFAKNAAAVPIAHSCLLGPWDSDGSADPKYVAQLIDRAIQDGKCAPGTYATDRFVFRAGESPAQLILRVGPLP